MAGFSSSCIGTGPACTSSSMRSLSGDRRGTIGGGLAALAGVPCDGPEGSCGESTADKLLRRSRQRAPPVLADLVGTWSSDCGLMTISTTSGGGGGSGSGCNGVPGPVHRGLVTDAHGETAPFIYTSDGHLELRFAGEVWHSKSVGRDHIAWDGDGGTWTRATSAPPAAASSITNTFAGDFGCGSWGREEQRTGMRPPSPQPCRSCSFADGPHVPPSPMAGYWPPAAGAYEGTGAEMLDYGPVVSCQLQAPPVGRERSFSPLPSSSFGRHQTPHRGLYTAGGDCVCGSPPVSLPPPASSPPFAVPSQGQWCGCGPTGPLVGSPQQRLDPHRVAMEAKVDFLANCVIELQGELSRMMQVRKAAANRRAVASIAATASASLADRQASMLPPSGSCFSYGQMPPSTDGCGGPNLGYNDFPPGFSVGGGGAGVNGACQNSPMLSRGCVSPPPSMPQPQMWGRDARNVSPLRDAGFPVGGAAHQASPFVPAVPWPSEIGWSPLQAQRA
eukprot:TRINITY_DN40197_c0_g1_i1.p1 TRINITY_DN40197_c0_g1~~TRINITY_DN40197_c0_g1_i1.p1  ORF type:complete len:503 (-),score=72.23 TRINITY_DN40197_c0_g1_i1:66-1574(-)